MPIRPFLSGQAFEPETIHNMSIALERVCAALGLTMHDDPATRLVAAKIIEMAQRGITDPTTISQLVLKEFDQRE
jgi:PIN domain nuclease of toxin-antitoxin system